MKIQHHYAKLTKTTVKFTEHEIRELLVAKAAQNPNVPTGFGQWNCELVDDDDGNTNAIVTFTIEEDEDESDG